MVASASSEWRRASLLVARLLELRKRVSIELDLARALILFEVGKRGGARDEQHVGAAREQPRETDLCGSGAHTFGDLTHDGLIADLRHAGKRGPQRKERHEGDAMLAAKLEHRLVLARNQAQLVLYAGDLGVVDPC